MHILRGSPTSKRGGALGDIRVFEAPYHVRGSGLLSVLRGIGRKAIPFLLKHVAPTASRMVKDVFSDLQEGKGIKSSLRSRGVSALKDVGKSVLDNRGGGRIRRGLRRRRRREPSKKRKKNKKRKGTCVKRYKRDIFDSMDI